MKSSNAACIPTWSAAAWDGCYRVKKLQKCGHQEGVALLSDPTGTLFEAYWRLEAATTGLCQASLSQQGKCGWHGTAHLIPAVTASIRSVLLSSSSSLSAFSLEWHLTHLSQNLLTGSVPGSVFAPPSGRLVGRDAKTLNRASICMRCIFIHPEIWSFYPKHSCDCLISNFITSSKIGLNDTKSRCLCPCRNDLVLPESFGVFISYTGVQVAALIFPLTCYMWQQEPSQISNRLCVLCFRGINTCSVCLTAVFVWGFTNKLN